MGINKSSSAVVAEDPSTWLTPAGLAERLGVSVSTVYAWRYNGTGPVAVRVGGRPRYRAEDVTAWLAARVEGGVR